MNEILKIIDERVEKLKQNNNSKNNHYLILSKKEYEILRDSLTSIKDSEILIYRKMFVRIKEAKNEL